MYEERISRTHFERSLLVQCDATISQLRYQQTLMELPQLHQMMEKPRVAALPYLRHQKIVNHVDVNDEVGQSYCRYMIETLRKQLAEEL